MTLSNRLKKTYLELHNGTRQIFAIGFGHSDEIVDADTALEPTQTPTVQVHELNTPERPETWTDITSKFTISGAVIVDHYEEDPSDPDEVVLVMENGAIQWRMERTTPGDPAAGDTYSVMVKANRADDETLQAADRKWLRLLP